jgi:hypothetical protein
MKPIPISEALLALSQRRTEHPIGRYVDAFAGTGWLVTTLAVGSDSVVFKLANGNILHITAKLLSPELGTPLFRLAYAGAWFCTFGRRREDILFRTARGTDARIRGRHAGIRARDTTVRLASF